MPDEIGPLSPSDDADSSKACEAASKKVPLGKSSQAETERRCAAAREYRLRRQGDQPKRE